MTTFHDRRQAGQLLARQVRKYAHIADTCVVALPRGGVPVAYEVARTLNAPLDVFIVRKLSVPGYDDVPMGAIAAGPTNLAKQLINWDVVRAWGVTNTTLNAIIGKEQRELLRREDLYRGPRNLGLSLTEKTVVLVDDGLAPMSTMRAAIAALREYQPTRVIVAIPIADPHSCKELSLLADDLVCSVVPPQPQSVDQWYTDIDETTDRDVQYLLVRAAREHLATSKTGMARVRAG
jgi:putative phosphoribosyl transferase